MCSVFHDVHLRLCLLLDGYCSFALVRPLAVRLLWTHFQCGWCPNLVSNSVGVGLSRDCDLRFHAQVAQNAAVRVRS